MIKAIFFDIGGVLLSKGWDHDSRREAEKIFHLDKGFEARHRGVDSAFECGRMSLDDYLDEVVFTAPREFSRAQFTDFIFSRQSAIPESLQLLGALAKGGRYWLATLNNESRELNEYRIERFGLRAHFTAFFSSCYVGLRKPDPPIYALALGVSQHASGDCLFIDDTPSNVDTAATLGMQTIHFVSPEQLGRELAARGVLSQGEIP